MSKPAENAPAGSASAFYIPATARDNSASRHVLKMGDGVAVFDENGNMDATDSAEGFFFRDTRYLSRLQLAIDGVAPLLLSSHLTENNLALEANLANPDLRTNGRLRLARDTVHIRRSLLVDGPALFETTELRSFGAAPLTFTLELRFGADFADIFEVRGSVRPRRGAYLADEKRPDGVVLGYRGLDQVVRRMRIHLDPPPQTVAAGRAAWTITLAPGERIALNFAFQCAGDEAAREPPPRQAGESDVARRLQARQKRAIAIGSSNAEFNDCVNRALADLDMLHTETPCGLYPYAGIPWFSAPFGRDGLITALQCLWFDPTIAAGTLRYLAARQATEVDPASDAEPGKIMHEERGGEMAALGEVPFGRYYGSIDATPLFIVLAAAYFERTGDRALIQELWPHIEAALSWMTRYGDRDGDGFLEYDRRSPDGLVNQGWKDSGDAIFHADGALAHPPIAVAEVQGYAFAAYRGAASLACAFAKPERAAQLDAMAAALARQFEARFWMEEHGTYALALDGAKQPCRVAASNAGQVLYAGLTMPARAARIADTLMAPASFSEWGIRTVAEGAARYNPMSYHNGSVWPHDNSIIAMGFARYGLKRPLLRVFGAMFEATRAMPMMRLPELFCGFARRGSSRPISYPVACNPQAWASAAMLGTLGAALGIAFDVPHRRVVFHAPVLPPWLDALELKNLRMGDGVADVTLKRDHEMATLEVTRRHGPIEVALASAPAFAEAIGPKSIAGDCR